MKHTAAMVMVSAILAASGWAGSTQSAAVDATTPSTRVAYENPATGDHGDVFADPTVIRGRDGYWYAYSTAAFPPEETPRMHNLPIIRSADLVNWEYLGDVFDESNYPEWLNPAKPIWAPEIDFIDGRYVLYYSAIDSYLYDEANRAIGVATAPTPAGPWTDAGRPVVEPQWWVPFTGQRTMQGIIDPELVTTDDGRHFLYYGGFNGGLFVVELSADGLRPISDATKVSTEYRYEAPYIVHRDGWYYMFVSTANCCSGPVSGYSVYVARSRTPQGPFVDREGAPILGSHTGGTPVLTQNGNRWVGTGHSSIATDVAGQQWLLYHAYDRDDPYGSPPVVNKRQLLIDRLDWIDGWPVVRAGAGPSDGGVPAPTTDARIADDGEHADAAAPTWRSTTGWTRNSEAAGGYLSTDASDGTNRLTARRMIPGDVRARAAVRLPGDHPDGQIGVSLSGRPGVTVDAHLDREIHELVLETGQGEPITAALPAGFDVSDWHELDVQVRGTSVTATVTNAGLYDPVAQVTGEISGPLRAARFDVVASDTAADVDDITVASIYEPVTELVPEPSPGTLDPAFSDDFDNADLGSAWSWVRDPVASTDDGRLVFPVQDKGFHRADNGASLLTRPAPAGEWIAETSVRLPFGTAQPTGFPQAGLLAYANDDLYVRLMTLAQGPLRRNDMLKEMPYDGAPVAGEAWIGAPGDPTTFLRLHHSTNDAGEHVLRAGTSTDGEHWTWGAAYTLPAEADLQLALAAFGRAGFTAEFDYLRVYRPAR